MNDAPLGPGWWQASDEKWYPPQPASPPPPVSPPPPAVPPPPRPAATPSSEQWALPEPQRPSPSDQPPEDDDNQATTTELTSNVQPFSPPTRTGVNVRLLLLVGGLGVLLIGSMAAIVSSSAEESGNEPAAAVDGSVESGVTNEPSSTTEAAAATPVTTTATTAASTATTAATTGTTAATTITTETSAVTTATTAQATAAAAEASGRQCTNEWGKFETDFVACEIAEAEGIVLARTVGISGNDSAALLDFTVICMTIQGDSEKTTVYSENLTLARRLSDAVCPGNPALLVMQ